MERHDIVTCCMFDDDRRERRSERLKPTVANGVEIGTEADTINLATAGETRDKHSAVIFPAFRIRRIQKQKSAPLRFRNAAAVLPPHQRMHDRIFIDRLFDNKEKARVGKISHVIVQIWIEVSRPSFTRRSN